VVQGAAIGTLSLSADAARGAYDERDLAMVEVLARRAGAAIEQALLHASVTEAHEQLTQQALELELQAQQLQDQATELESQKEELEALNEELLAASESANAARLAAESAEHHVRGILEAISDPFVVHDADWRFRYINASAAASFRASGHAGEALVGQVVWDAYPDIVGTSFEREMRRSARERVPASFQEFYPGSSRWVELTCYPLVDGGLATIWKDITEQKRAAEAMHYLSRAGEILATSLDHEATMAAIARLMVPDFADWCTVDLVDAAGALRKLAVAHADPARVEWARELGRRYPTDLHATMGAPNVLRTGRSELHADITDEILVALARDAEHLEIVRGIGVASVIIVPLAAHGRTLGVMSLVTAESGRRYTEADVRLAEELARRAALAIDNARLYHEAVEARERLETQAVELEAQSEELQGAQAELEVANDELHRANEELLAQTVLAERARIEAERANRAKSDFLAVMSHELRTPLNAIGGYAQLIEMGVHGPVTDAQREALARIARSQHHLLALINDVLNFAKLEAGRVQYRVERIPVDDALVELEALVAPQLAAKAIRFEHRAADASLAVDADADKLQQILLNLLSNAIKFTPAGGRIAVGARADGAMVCIDVEDSGEGIPHDKHETVFEPFVQLARDGRTAQEGTGLGLSISRDLARAMGGELVVESDPGAGSRFTLALPRSRGPGTEDRD
jgi:PAS domain S-box-containing protein